MKLKINKKERYILACSYGPDSMCLFDLLYKNKVNFIPVLINYNLRPESVEEETGFKKHCEKLNIKYYVKEVPANSIKGNVENACRKIRYAYFKEVGDIEGIDKVLVAHHLDDLIETYIMQKERKNLVNYFGIAQNSYVNDMKIIRPLLEYTHNEIEQYNIDNNVPFAIDSSNLKNDYRRNRIRHEIIDKMSNSEKQLMLMEIIKKNIELQNKLNFIASHDLTSISFLLTLDDEMFCYALNMILENSGINVQLSKNRCMNFKEILKSDRPNVMIRINAKTYLCKEYKELHLRNFCDFQYCFKLEKPEILDNPYFYLDATNFKNKKITSNSYPITIKNLDPNADVPIKNYKVKARRLFIDWKMPLYLRKVWPVFLDKDENIIFVPRYQADCRIEDNPYFYVKSAFSLK